MSRRLPIGPSALDPRHLDPSVASHDRSARRVLIVGINYDPEPAGIAPYTTAAARHLAQSGNAVEVWTGLPHYPSWTVPKAYQNNFRSRRRDHNVLVRRFAHYVPRSQNAPRRAFYELTFGLQVAATRWLERPDVILCVIPSLLSAAWLSFLGRRRGVPVAIWIQDLMAQAAVQSGMPGGKTVEGAAAFAERIALQHAQAVGVVSEAFRDHVETVRGHSRGIVRIRNWSHVASPQGDRERWRNELGWGTEETIIVHAGNMGLKQGLEVVVEAARQSGARALNLRFVLIGEGSQKKAIQELSKDVPTISLLDPIPADSFTAVLSAADILLVNERKGVREMSLPSKLTSYLVVGRPILAAVERGGSTAEEVHRSGAGLVVATGDPEALISGVQALKDDPIASRSMGAQGETYARRHLSAQAGFQSIEQLLDQAVSIHRSADDKRQAVHGLSS